MAERLSTGSRARRFKPPAVHVASQNRASVEALKAWKGSQLPLLRSLSAELTIQRENLIYHLGEEWKSLVIWKLPPSKGTIRDLILNHKQGYSNLQPLD